MYFLFVALNFTSEDELSKTVICTKYFCINLLETKDSLKTEKVRGRFFHNILSNTYSKANSFSEQTTDIQLKFKLKWNLSSLEINQKEEQQMEVKPLVVHLCLPNLSICNSCTECKQ